MWQQRSHTHWMVSGDKNTAYFHNRASQRFRRNNISELRALDGRIVLGDENIATMIVDYYQHLFTSSNPSDIEEVVQHTSRKVNEFKSDWGTYQGRSGSGFETNGPLEGSESKRHASYFFPALLGQYWR